MLFSASKVHFTGIFSSGIVYWKYRRLIGESGEKVGQNELEIIQHPQMDGISLFFDTIDYRTPHIHSEWELLWVMENSLSITCEGRQIVAAPGQLVLFSPRQPHEFHGKDGSCTFLCLQVSPLILSRFCPGIERVSVDELFPRNALSPADSSYVMESLYAMTLAYLKQSPFYELYCAGQTCLIWNLLLTRLPCRTVTTEEAALAEKRSARLSRLIQYVDENYMHRIRLSDFAKQEGCTMNHMSFFVHRNLNQSFQEYVNTVRFHCACKLIDAGHTRMTDVCLESGFSDYRYFSRTFREKLGMTPEEYSRRVQPAAQEFTKLHHSIHSRERFYTREKSLSLCEILHTQLEEQTEIP